MSDELDYWEVKNVKDTAFGDGKSEVKMERTQEIAKTLKDKQLSIEFIMEVTGLKEEEIEKL